MKKWGNMFQTKEKHKSLETNPAEMGMLFTQHRIQNNGMNMLRESREQCINKVRILTKK